MDVSGNPLKRPSTPMPALISGIKTLDDLFALMGKNETLETFKDLEFVATGKVTDTKPLLESEMELPEPMSVEMNALPIQPRFSGLSRFKPEVPDALLHHQTACNSPHRTSSEPEARSQ